MRALLALLSVGATGCQLVFSVDPPSDAPATPPGPCATKAGAVVDSFQQQSVQWVEFPNGNVISYGTGLQLNMSGGAATYIQNAAFYDLRESSFFVKVAPTPLDTADTIFLDLIATDYRGSLGHTIRIGRRGNMMVAEFVEDNTINTPNMVSYNPDEHAIWKIARTDNTTTWSTINLDGVETTLATSDLDWTNYLMPGLFSDRDEASTVQYTADFNDFNGGSAATADPVCPADSLIDTFDAIDRVTWGRSGAPTFETGCTMEARDGALVAILEPGGGPGSCVFGSSGIYNLIDRTFTLEIEADLKGLERVGIAIETFDDKQGLFRLQNGKLQALTRTGSTENASGMKDYDPIAHRFWRVTATNDNGLEELEFQTSPTGLPGTFEFLARPSLTGLDRVRFSLGVVGDSADSSATIIKFHGVN